MWREPMFVRHALDGFRWTRNVVLTKLGLGVLCVGILITVFVSMSSVPGKGSMPPGVVAVIVPFVFLLPWLFPIAPSEVRLGTKGILRFRIKTTWLTRRESMQTCVVFRAMIDDRDAVILEILLHDGTSKYFGVSPKIEARQLIDALESIGLDAHDLTDKPPRNWNNLAQARAEQHERGP